MVIPLATLLDRLESLVPGASRRTLRQYLERGRVLVDGVEARKGAEAVPDGATIAILPKAAALARPPVPILFEDAHLLVAEKPAGLLSVSTREAGRESLWSKLRKMLKVRAKGESIHLVHRIDERTSGVLVFAKSEAARAGLKKIFERHDVERRYAAIVEGAIREPSGEFQSSLVEVQDDPLHRVRSVKPRDSASVKKASKHAQTRFKVLAAGAALTAVEVKLETGRKHQIRAHFSEAGHPVLGDTLYGGSRASRLYLHAWVLGFTHPVTKEALRFVSKPGREFAERFKGVFERPPHI